MIQKWLAGSKDTLNTVVPLYVGGEQCQPGWGWGPAIRREWLLHYVLSGKGIYTVEGKSYTVQKDQAFLIRPGEVTYYKADEEDPWKYIWIGLRTDIPTFETMPYIIENKELTSILRKYSNTETIFRLNELHTAALAWSVVACLSENMYGNGRTGYTERALQIMDRRYMEDISVRSIADMLNIDRSYFSNLFKREVGVSPQRYLIDIRMKRALELLREERYTVSVVAASVGYDDLFTFSRCFKKHYGVPPTAYKELQ